MDLPYLYQLQQASFGSLASQDFRVAVVDMDDAGLGRAQVARLEAQNKTLLTYLSIGEAEDYRAYWPWLTRGERAELVLEENPDWDGNFRVRFWEADWQEVIFNQVEKAVALGYGGVYLDIVDAYTIASVEARYDGADLRQEMIDFVIDISERAKALDPDFLIVPQNAVGLLETEDGPRLPNRPYLEAIDGIGVEDLWFDDDQVSSWTRWDLHFLETALRADKFVLATSYPSETVKQAAFIEKALDAGFVPFVGTRALDGKVPRVNGEIPEEMKGHDISLPPISIRGSSRSETINGTEYEDRIFGHGGHDSLRAGPGDDDVYGGLGHDALFGGWGKDSLAGGPGNDRLNGYHGWDELRGGVGDDRLNGGAGGDLLVGWTGRDILHGGAGVDALWGGPGRDTLVHDPADRAIGGGSGFDTLRMDAGGWSDFGSPAIKSGIERLDLGNGRRNGVTVEKADVRQNTDTRILYIDGDREDRVWSDFEMREGSVRTNGTSYAHFVDGEADLYIELGLAMNGELLEWT